MSEALKIGIKHETTRTVTPDQTARKMGSGGLDVFATPAMIALMEYTAFTAVAPYLEPGKGTVGTCIECRHLAATPVGAAVTCVCELTEIDRKRLRFQIEVRDAAGVIGTAVHDRFIVDDAAFTEKCNARQAGI